MDNIIRSISFNLLKRKFAMDIKRTLLILMLITIFLAGFLPGSGYAEVQLPVTSHTPEQFISYWYPNGAEVSRFSLKQARYGEIHEGDAVLIFVTESMNPAMQVKADYPDMKDIPVLKHNSIRKFYTGIYPYSIMTSVFSPVDYASHPLPLKVSFSSQEWCGQAFVQMNLKEGGYSVESHSYFEKEGDRNFQLEKVLPEEAIWTQIRIAPQKLPLGEIRIIPAALFSRLAHLPLASQKAVATLGKVKGRSLEDNPLAQYQLFFPASHRTLKILFERDFPYRIQAWEDTNKGMGDNLQTTSGVRTHTIMSEYWNHHGNKDRELREKLGLGIMTN
jgi:hypothetical protein